nr:heavy-metal-associated domain-containing protein [Enterococcus timonensis]
MEKIYTVNGMKCDGCANTVTEKLSEVSGVEHVEVDLAAKTATVTGNAKPRKLAASLKDTPYSLA